MALKLTQRLGRVSEWGTVNNPLPLELRLREQEPPPVLLEIELGHAIPSTTVYEFTLPRTGLVQLRRVSGDNYAAYVSAAIEERSTRRRIGRLITFADGGGEPVLVPAGTHLLIVSLDISETVSFRLEVTAKPRPITVAGMSQNTATARIETGSDLASLQGISENLRAISEAQLLSAPAAASWVATGSSSAVGALGDPEESSNQVAGAVDGEAPAAASTAPFFWIDRRGRRMGPNVRITPFTYNEVIWRRADYHLLLRVTDDGGDPVDLTPLTVQVAVHDGRRFVRYGNTTIDPAGLALGLIDARLGWEETLAMGERAYIDVLLSNGSGEQQYPLEGALQLEEGITE